MGKQEAPGSPEKLSPSALPNDDAVPDVEVSMVEAEDVTGVTFSPELWMQRRHWALEVLRREGVRSVLDMGCGPGALLETLVIPPSTIYEPPLLAGQPEAGSSSSGPAAQEQRELHLMRLAGLDASANVIPSALSILAPPNPSASFPPNRPRWEKLKTEMWLGGIEKYNAHLEGYEAIVALELIEHLDPNVLSRFGVVTMGTYKPRLLLVTTPNFDFNAKFPHDHDHCFAKKGFVDPTGRTDRVFRHSDHKLEMTSAEFREWAEGAAADWGYDVEISGVGTSSKPSFYPSSDPSEPPKPIYASQTAIFRMASGVPARSPRSVRSSELPFLSKESSHPHKLAGKFVHPVTADASRRTSPADLRAKVEAAMQEWAIGQVSLAELWGRQDIAEAAGGSQRYLVSSLGGWGDVPSSEGQQQDFEIKKGSGAGLVVVWKGFTPAEGKQKDEGQPATAAAQAAQPGPGGW